jgi:hypothetical protein
MGRATSAAAVVPEPVFSNILRSPGIDYPPGGPIRQPTGYRLHRLEESIPRLYTIAITLIHAFACVRVWNAEVLVVWIHLKKEDLKAYA